MLRLALGLLCLYTIEDCLQIVGDGKNEIMKKAIYAKQPQDAAGQVFHRGEKTSVRINKYLTACGYCSRRQADRLIGENRVCIDGQPAEVGSQVVFGQTVQVDGQTLATTEQHIYIALHKPVGITCTTEQGQADNIVDYMGLKQRIFPVGRLDKDSSGLILLTSDGDIVNEILRAENNHEKEYVVQVNRDITPVFLQKMGQGVEITNMRVKQRETTQPCRIWQIGPRRFHIVLTQGLNRQIRRMCTELGYRAVQLCRIRIMNIALGDLPVGHWRYLTQQELDVLAQSL